MAAKFDILRGFRAKAEAIQTHPPFDPLSIPAYSIFIVTLIFEMIVISSTNLSVSSNALLNAFYSSGAIAISGLAARRYGFMMVSNILQGIAIPALSGALISVANVMGARVSAPFADHWLNAADNAMGLNWISLLSVYQHHPWLTIVSTYVYKSMIVQMALVPVMLFTLQHQQRSWEFINAWIIGGLITAVIFPFAPAVGPYVYYALPKDSLPDVVWDWPWTFGASIADIRSGQIHDVNSLTTGLVSFPSFHTVAAIIFARSMWKISKLRWIFLLLNAMMIFSTVIRGSHYFVDVMGGAAVALLSIYFSVNLTEIFLDVREKHQ